MNKAYCCLGFERALEEEAIERSGDKYWISAYRYVDDGDGYIDKMSDWSREVVFCPFCGVKIG